MARFRLFDLNDAQRDAVTTIDGPLLILAGAGTGKTRVITARVAYLIANGVDPGAILAVTFTNKAAAEMRERLARMIEPAAAKQVTMSTFHALCLRILRSGIDRLGYKNNFSIYDEGDQLGLIKKLITRTAARDEKLDPNVAKALISKAKNSTIQDIFGDSLIGEVARRYDAELKRLNAVDFDDLLLLTVRLLRDHEPVRARWRAKFRYLMIDEFQDTNRLQLDLVTLLADERRNVAVVGDDDQSIYGWRGAEVANILEFEHHFPNPKIVRLEQNYRSTNAILGSANSLIKNNPRRRPKKLWSASESGDKVRLIACPTDREEAQFIAEEIQRRNFSESDVWESFAVLFRMNAQSRLLEENFRRLQIPYRIVGGKSFFDRREVKDVLAYMSVLANPNDDASLLRIINTPARGISPATVETALESSVKHRRSVWQALQSDEVRGDLSAKTATNVARFVQLVDDCQTSLSQPLADAPGLIRKLLDEVSYAADLRRNCKSPDEADIRAGNVTDVLRDFEQFTRRSTKGLRGFLDEVVLDQEREEEKEEDIDKKRGVTLITMHAAKGLEFPHVYIVGLEEGILPHDRSKTEGTLDEERRLLYVGITRAMRSLTLTLCRARTKFGSAVSGQPSSFIKELAPEFIEVVNLQKLLSAPVTETTAKSRFAQMRAAIQSP
ncbi:MAG TPA: UvrD-helicase domain-containing protein [Chthoniobacterales bacterium]|jgi:superfamily I DNA/RNA helicase|nr:UvrD-helicase domain-containing protein [Chthoniobacterales bacterium]